MMKNYCKIQLDIIGLEDILSRVSGSYKVRIEALKEPIVLNSGEEINKKVYYTMPRKTGEDCSTPYENFIDDMATLFLADMVRAKKCTI